MPIDWRGAIPSGAASGSTKPSGSGQAPPSLDFGVRCVHPNLVRGNPRASQIVFLELLYNLQYIYTSWENTEEDPTPRTRHHTLQFAHMALHRRHKHSVTDGTAMDESRACDDADDGTAVGEGHTQGSMQGSCDGQGRSRLVLLLPVFSRRFHLVLADSFLRSFLRSPSIRLVIRSTCRTELPRCEQGSMISRAD